MILPCMYVCMCVFWPRAAYAILVPRPWIAPALPTVEAQGLNHWTAREVPLPCI